MKICDMFFALLSFDIKEKELCKDTKNLITPDFFSALFKLSKKHDLAHLVGDALDKNGLLLDNLEEKKLFLKERNLAMLRYEKIQYELEKICDTLEKANIPFIPLKGSVLRKFYPEPWMRTSCDIDILVKEKDLPNAINVLKQELEYHHKSTGNHDAQLYTKLDVHIELHYKLNASNKSCSDILDNVWNHLVDDKSCHKKLTEEMFYFYHIAHMAEHFKVGGCGVRSFLDLYLLRKNITYNQETLAKLLGQGELTLFNSAVCALTDYWFNDGEETSLILEMNDFILSAGMYGDMKNRVAITKAKKKSKLKMLFSRIFAPYNELKYQYVTLQNHPILYPFYVVKRWFKLFKKDSYQRAKIELIETTHGNEEKQKRIAKLIKDLGL